MDAQFDIVIVGAGMAGASLAAMVAGQRRVLVIEAEDQPGYHTTGRSAAFWMESYGGPAVQPLTAASEAPLRAMGALTRRTAMTMARDDQGAELDAFAATYRHIGVQVERLGREDMVARVPGLRASWTRAVLEPTCCDIDVARVHQHYLARARQAGAELWSRASLVSARRNPDGWHVTLAGGRVVEAAVLVNAAGAWADPVAQMAGVRPLGIRPLRRTIAQIAVSPAVRDDLPLVLDIGGTFYFKPENGRLWLSPHDETPSVPCDAAADKQDVALALDRLSRVVDWSVESVERRWAGLRSFAPDRLPVYGFDMRDPAFFWFAGQGGFGIQTAPAAAELGARLLLRQPQTAIDAEPYAPARLG